MPDAAGYNDYGVYNLAAQDAETSRAARVAEWSL